jgi:hypothetical protein
VAAVTRRLERWAQGWVGPTTTISSSTPISWWRSPVGGGHGELGAREAEGGLVGAERDQPPGQEVLGDRQAGRDGELGAAVLAERGDAGVELLGGVDDPAGPVHHQVAGLRQRRAPSGAGQQRGADQGLGRTDPRRRSLLGDAELGGGGGEAAGAGDDHQQLERAEVRHVRTQHGSQGYLVTAQARPRSASWPGLADSGA